MLKYIPKLKKKIHVNRTSKMFYSIEAVTERGARGHYCYAAKLFRLCTYLNVEVVEKVWDLLNILVPNS